MKSQLMAWHGQISSYFFQSRKTTTPIGVIHVKTSVQEVHGMLAEHALSTFLRWNVLEPLVICLFHGFW